jgi:hypothetical protein
VIINGELVFTTAWSDGFVATAQAGNAMIMASNNEEIDKPTHRICLEYTVGKLKNQKL